MTNERNEQEFVDRIKNMANDYNAPSDIPREAMWERISARREGVRAEGPRDNVVALPIWRRRPVWMSAAVAALMIVAFSIGRLSVPDSPGQDAPHSLVANNDNPVQSSPEALGSDVSKQDLYRLAAAPVLGDAEVLLMQFKNNGKGSDDGKGYADRAAALLADTRFLIDSPASEDAELRYLLTDLELVLAQIVRVAQQKDDKIWAQESMKNRAILDRLKSEVAANKFM